MRRLDVDGTKLTHSARLQSVCGARRWCALFCDTQDHRRPRFYWHNLLTRPKNNTLYKMLALCMWTWTLMCTRIRLTGLKALFHVTWKLVKRLCQEDSKPRSSKGCQNNIFIENRFFLRWLIPVDPGNNYNCTYNMSSGYSRKLHTLLMNSLKKYDINYN